MENIINKLSKELSSHQFSEIITTPKVSVIIPAYNVEKYIIECLKSVIFQSLKDIEIIVVNDGSTDNTLEIIKTFMKYDSRIRLIDRENRGVGVVKNDALNHAKGECVSFIDSDDVVEFDMLEKAYNKYNETKSNVVVFGAYALREGKRKKCLYGIEKIPAKFRNKTVFPKDIQKILFKLPLVAMCKIYNREFLLNNNIRFQEGCIGEDQIFFLKAILLSDKIFILNKNLYGYRRNRKDSLTFKKKKENNSVILNFYEIENFVKSSEFSQKLKIKILDKYFGKCVSWLGKCSDEYRGKYFADLEKLHLFLIENYPNLCFDKITIKEKDAYLKLKLKLCCLKMRRLLNGKH